MTNDNDSDRWHEQRHTRRQRYAEKGRFFLLRNILNIIFIALALVGMALYFYGTTRPGAALLIAAVAVKSAECVLRIIR